MWWHGSAIIVFGDDSVNQNIAEFYAAHNEISHNSTPYTLFSL